MVSWWKRLSWWDRGTAVIGQGIAIGVVLSILGCSSAGTEAGVPRVPATSAPVYTVTPINVSSGIDVVTFCYKGDRVFILENDAVAGGNAGDGGTAIAAVSGC